MATVDIIIKKNLLPGMGALLKQRVSDEVARAALALEGQEKAIIVQVNAVDTGNMLNSVAAEPVGEMTWVVGNGAEYSVYVNYGTARMPARPFVEPAVEIIKPQFIANLGNALDGLA